MDIHFAFIVINFALFLGLLRYLLKRPLKEFWGNRAEGLRAGITLAQEKRSRAEEAYKKITERVTLIEKEMHALKERMRHNGELEKQRILQNAEAYAERMIDATKRISKQEMAKARYRLRRSVARLTVYLAEEAIRKRMTANDHERLTIDFLNRLETQEMEVIERRI